MTLLELLNADLKKNPELYPEATRWVIRCGALMLEGDDGWVKMALNIWPVGLGTSTPAYKIARDYLVREWTSPLRQWALDNDLIRVIHDETMILDAQAIAVKAVLGSVDLASGACGFDASKFAKPGEVCSGTLRWQDLIPAFVNAHPRGEALLESDTIIKTWYFNRALVTKDSREILTVDDEYANEFLHETLIPAMDEIAPPRHYFGAHEGDGACFGFWALEPKARTLKDAFFEGWKAASACVAESLAMGDLQVTTAWECSDSYTEDNTLQAELDEVKADFVRLQMHLEAAEKALKANEMLATADMSSDSANQNSLSEAQVAALSDMLYNQYGVSWAHERNGEGVDVFTLGDSEIEISRTTFTCNDLDMRGLVEGFFYAVKLHGGAHGRD